MTENALKGIYNGGTIPFGYMIDETRHYQPDPLLAPYVEQTFQKYADGATMTDLRDWLKAHKIKNSMGGEMSYNTIQRMLSNRRYIGELRLRDVVQPNAIPALLDMHSHTIIFFFESDFFYANAVLFTDNSVFQTFYVA